MAAKKHHSFPLDHPFIQAGLWPESLIHEVWPMHAEYRRAWAKEAGIPFKSIGGQRWFYRDDIVNWFRKQTGKGPTSP